MQYSCPIHEMPSNRADEVMKDDGLVWLVHLEVLGSKDVPIHVVNSVQ